MLESLGARVMRNTLGRATRGGPSELEVRSEQRAARIEAARLAKAAVAGIITTDEARDRWPLPEGGDPSVDALAHIYFDHYVWTAKRSVPDEFDVASVIDLAEAMADGDPLDEGYQRQFRPGRGIEFNLGQVFAVVLVIALAIYLVVRFF